MTMGTTAMVGKYDKQDRPLRAGRQWYQQQAPQCSGPPLLRRDIFVLWTEWLYYGTMDRSYMEPHVNTNCAANASM
jgi:hypothetical protein